jgi:aryl-alcohol dehydrogenase-like predicted oxidoreductase
VPYGITNKIGLPTEADAVALVKDAIDAGITTIDTARVYGLAEARIGQALRGAHGVTIVTKLDPLDQIAADAPAESAVAAAEASVAASRAALERDRLDVVLLHRAEHRTAWGGAVWHHLSDMQAQARIGALGISAQSPAELLDSLTDPRVAHVQLPFNLLDWRWTEAGAIDALRARPSVNVHIRSVFLQGLLANDIERWSAVHGVSSLAINQRLDRLAAETGRQNRADLCIAFLRSQDWIDGLVIGMEHSDQLRNNLELFSRPPLVGDECERIYSAVPRLPEALLNPVQWAKDDSENPKSILLRSNT